MIAQNISKDDVEFQRSEIISDLWKDLANNENNGDYKLEHCRYETYEPKCETYIIVPTIRGRWLMIKIEPLTMRRDCARILDSIRHNYSRIMLSHINKCKSVAKQYFRDINENPDIQ